jgi:thiol-disulfide isomerase/thioredoxin
MLSTPNGTKAVGIKMPEPLTNEMLRDTIPMVQVPEAAELLRRFDEAQARSEGIGVSSGRTEPLLKEGTKFPEFTATDMNGRTWSNADVKGKVMVLNVWFTGCGPCRAEMPELSAWKDEMPGVMFFSSTFESAKVARPVIESRGFNWIPLVNDTVLYKYVGNNGFPLTVVIDKEGTVVMAEHGTSATKREALKRKIKSLIK